MSEAENIFAAARRLGLVPAKGGAAAERRRKLRDVAEGLESLARELEGVLAALKQR